MIFHTNGLLSKWGFDDGDMLSDLCYDLEDAEGVVVNDKVLLVEVVKRHIIPALDQSVVYETVQTIHNPIRAAEVDGKDVRAAHYEPDYPDILTPAEIEIADADILSVARELADERVPESEEPR